MGRKGVSKRKASKSKNVMVSSGAGSGAISSIARVSDTPLPHPVAKGEAISSSKKNKKK